MDFDNLSAERLEALQDRQSDFVDDVKSLISRAAPMLDVFPGHVFGHDGIASGSIRRSSEGQLLTTGASFQSSSLGSSAAEHIRRRMQHR